MPVGLVLLAGIAATIAIPKLVGIAVRRWSDDVGDYLTEQHPLDRDGRTNWPIGGGAGYGGGAGGMG